MANFKQSKLFDIVKKMPPLQHSAHGCDFDIKDSEVVKWLMSEPRMLQYVFDLVRQSGAIVFDKDTGTWKGTDYGSAS